MPKKLSTNAQEDLLSLKGSLRKFLKIFAKLAKTDPAYRKYRKKVNAMRSMYFEIDALELTEASATAACSSVPEKEKGTPKEGRKKRREDRKKSQKAARAKKRAQRASEKIERKKQKGDKTGNKEEGVFRFEKLKAVWDAVKFEEITEDFREYLDQAEQFLKDAEHYVSFVESFLPGQFDKEVDQVKEFIAKINRFLVLARQVSKQVDRYAKLAKDLINVITNLPRTVEDLKDGVVVEATRIFAAAKKFIVTADTTDPEIAAKVKNLQGYLDQGKRKLSQLENLVGGIIEDKDKDNLPDWYNRLEEKYNAIFALVKDTGIDDKVLLKITGFKKSVDEFIAATSDKVEEFAEKLKNIQQWLEQIGEFTKDITSFVEHVKEGDLVKIYQDLKDFKKLIEGDKDLFHGTKIDEETKKKLREHSKKAETWLMSKLAGNDPDKKKEVKEIMGAIDKLILSSGEVVDHSSKYEKDNDRIKIPDIKDVSQAQVKEMLKNHGIRDVNASYEGILSDIKDQADAVAQKAGVKFQDSAKRGAKASEAFVDAKEEYDDAVKKHNDYFKSTNVLGKKIINGLLSIAGLAVDSFALGAGSVIKALGTALFGEFTAINKEIEKLIPNEIIGDLAKGLLPAILPQIASEKGSIAIEGKELMKGLNDLYSNGVTARYQEVLSLLSAVKANTSNLSKNLRKVENAPKIDKKALAALKKKVIILALKWKGLQKEIMNKYVNLTYPAINSPKAYRYASRYLYSVWLIRFPQKEIRIGNSLINQFEKFGILTEANVEWKTGFFSKLGRSFFGFFGADPHNYRDKIKSLKRWANGENDRLKTVQAWSKVFA